MYACTYITVYMCVFGGIHLQFARVHNKTIPCGAFSEAFAHLLVDCLTITVEVKLLCDTIC